MGDNVINDSNRKRGIKMLSKNNVHQRIQNEAKQMPHYGIRKLSIGVASVLLGTTLFFGVQAQADTNTPENNTSVLKMTDEAPQSTTEQNKVTTTNQAIAQSVSSKPAPIQINGTETIKGGDQSVNNGTETTKGRDQSVNNNTMSNFANKKTISLNDTDNSASESSNSSTPVYLPEFPDLNVNFPDITVYYNGKDSFQYSNCIPDFIDEYGNKYPFSKFPKILQKDLPNLIFAAMLSRRGR